MSSFFPCDECKILWLVIHPVIKPFNTFHLFWLMKSNFIVPIFHLIYSYLLRHLGLCSVRTLNWNNEKYNIMRLKTLNILSQCDKQWSEVLWQSVLWVPGDFSLFGHIHILKIASLLFTETWANEVSAYPGSGSEIIMTWYGKSIHWSDRTCGDTQLCNKKNQWQHRSQTQHLNHICNSFRVRVRVRVIIIVFIICSLWFISSSPVSWNLILRLFFTPR